MLLAATPLAAANAYAYSGTIVGRGPLVGTAAHLFTFQADAGDVIVVTLTWADAAKDLDLALATPDATCDLNPNPDAPCLVDHYARVPTCGEPRPITGPHGEETITLVAAETGSYTAEVRATLAIGATDYALTISVNDEAPAVDGPNEAVVVSRPNLECKASG